ncbi:MAG: PAS domain S-box protein, partial [Elusimicrobia bacterium]|nr:PAS domain S-box protein [Elusimicrobiota bacterium]
AGALAEGGRSVVVANALEHPLLAKTGILMRRGVQFLAFEPGGPGLALCVGDYRPRSWSPAEARSLGAWAGLLDPAVEAFDPATGAYAAEFFRGLCDAEAGQEKPRGLVLAELVPFEEIARDSGAASAERLLGRLAGTLRSRTRESDLLGRLPGGRLALWLEATPMGIEAVVRKLSGAVRSDFRFPVRLAALVARARLDESLAAAERELAVAKRPRPAPGSGPTWEQRYQRLMLLHRVALKLFSGAAFEEALSEASDPIAALAGARRLAIRRFEPPDRLLEAFDRGVRNSPHAALAESASREAWRSGKLEWRAGPGTGWLAIPVPPWEKRAPPSGILALGYDDEEGPDAERRELLGEVALLLRNAFAAQKQLRQQSLLAAVSEQSADPVILTDLEDRITSWSVGAEKLFGWASGEVLGRELRPLLVHPDQAAEYENVKREALERGSTQGFESVRLTKAGQLVPIEATLTLVRDETGKPFGMVRILRDITRRKELDRMKSEFITLVSHELRTPMTSIRGFAETLLEFWKQLPEDQIQRYLRIQLEESKRLSRLVTDFLDTSRLEAGAAAIHPKAVIVPALVERVASVFEGHPAGIQFDLRVEPGLPVVWADEDQIERVLVNLCGNAVKYSPRRGTVTISARRRGGQVELEVADQGPGIQASSMPRLFQKFYRASDEVATKTPGTGLGLYIAKTIVEAHGGRIGAESRPGEGTRMMFDLPIAKE